MLHALATVGLACGDRSVGPVDVSLAELSRREASYQGELVRVRGVVRSAATPRHYWVEDHAENRVGLEPDEQVAPFAGQEVQVVGRFAFADLTGRVIDVDTIERAPSSDPAG